MPISDKIKEYLETAPLKFHTPGHKGKLVPEDITELYFSDDYFEPRGIIRTAMDKAAAFYGSKETFLLVNGSSIGIHSAIRAAGSEKYVAAANSHQSVFNGIKLAGAEVCAVGNEIKDGIHYPLTPEQVKAALRSTGARAVVLTSPDYFGLTADTAAIYDICREYGAVLITDSAHGAHFPACDLFPVTKADITIASAHKTMPALTQGAFLNVYNGEYTDRVRNALYIYASTSPSYLIMSSLEYAIDYTTECPGYYYYLYKLIEPLKGKYPFVKNGDFTRLVLDCRGAGGGKIVNTLLREYNVIPEKVFGDYIIFIITLADTEQTLRRLDKALECIFR